jgi:SAM-dependent methyltransferase
MHTETCRIGDNDADMPAVTAENLDPATGSTGAVPETSGGAHAAAEDRGFWDAAAETFDDEPDHGLRDPRVRDAWAARLRSWLPAEPSDVLDLGCGTGSLALLAARAGHRVTAVDRSERMVAHAREKLAGTGARVLAGDAAQPPVANVYDVVLVRHVLWTLPDPAAVLRRWAHLLRPGGRLVLVEGRWGTLSPVGITADTLAELAAPLGGTIRIEQLGHDAVLWGRAVDDERYAAVVRPAVRRRHAEIVDVHLILLRGEEVLLSRRADTGYADGLLHAPSGHVEDGEDVRTAMIREAHEEIGVELAPEDLEAVLVMQHRAPDEGQLALSRAETTSACLSPAGKVPVPPTSDGGSSTTSRQVWTQMRDTLRQRQTLSSRSP